MSIPLISIDAENWINIEKVTVTQAAYLLAEFEPPIATNKDDFPLDKIRQIYSWIIKNVPIQKLAHQSIVNHNVVDETFNHTQLLFVSMNDLIQALLSNELKSNWGNGLINAYKSNRNFQKKIRNNAPDIKQYKAIDNNQNTKERRELGSWLNSTWLIENKPSGKEFFKILEQYVNKEGSPIKKFNSAGKQAGFYWCTSYGTDGFMKKKTLSNLVSDFKKTQFSPEINNDSTDLN